MGDPVFDDEAKQRLERLAEVYATCDDAVWSRQYARDIKAALEEIDRLKMATIEAVLNALRLAQEVHSLAGLLIEATGQNVVVSDLSGRLVPFLNDEEGAVSQLARDWVMRGEKEGGAS